VNFIKTIQTAIERHGLILEGEHVVVGLSGGADSVALAHAFHQLRIPFTAAHLNHNLRGTESDADEAFVRSLGFPTVVKSVDVKSLATEKGESIEMAARRARHAFFAEFDHAVIALAHHADDQAETFLLKLARGAGSDGLSGMAHKQQLASIRLIRPMLDIPRAEILEWLQTNGVAWREDTSNADEAFLRNRVRHTILPLLERELNPNIRSSILRSMDILREENAWMEQLETENLTFETETPLAARRRILRKWLFKHGLEHVSFDAVEQILEQIKIGEGTSVFELNSQQRVVVEYGIPRIETSDKHILTPEWKLSVEHGTGWRKDGTPKIGLLPAEASFDAEKVGSSPITVRAWQPGDRIAPLGMEGSRKLQDIFTDSKIPTAQRSCIPVVVCRDEIIWLPGYRTARDWAVQGNHGKSVHIRIERNHPD
jgi:tRNA(Ile)-lysidine synthase